VARSAASSKTVSPGISQRTTVNAPAAEPTTNFDGRSAYRSADATIAADGQRTDSSSGSAGLGIRRRAPMGYGFLGWTTPAS
jgi:hypothetical protein